MWKLILPQYQLGVGADVHLLQQRLLLNETFNGSVYDPTRLRAQGCHGIVCPSTSTALRESIQVICQLVVSSPVNGKVELKWKLTGSHLERGYGVNTSKVKLLSGVRERPASHYSKCWDPIRRDQEQRLDSRGKPFRVQGGTFRALEVR